VSSGAELSSVTTDEFDRETIGSITTESDSRNAKLNTKLPVIEEKPAEIEIPKPVPVETVSTPPPAENHHKYKSINVKCNPKNSGENELAALVKRLTGNDFKNTTTSHPSKHSNWVPMSKSSDDNGTSSEPVSDPSEPIKPNEPQAPPVQQAPVSFKNTAPVLAEEPVVISPPEIPPPVVIATPPIPTVAPVATPVDVPNTVPPAAPVTAPVAQPTPVVESKPPVVTNIPQNDSFQKTLETKTKPGGFRSVRRPIVRKVSDVSMTSESESESLNRPPRPSLPVPRNYRDIVMSKLAQRNAAKLHPNYDQNKGPEMEHRPEEVLSDGNQNTSDDAESIPISYRVEQENKKFEELSQAPLETVTEDADAMEIEVEPVQLAPVNETEEISEVSEVPHEELKKNLSNHQKVPTKARKPLVRKVSANIQQIPEEKSEMSGSGSDPLPVESPSTNQKENVPDVPEKKKRRNKKSKPKEEVPSVPELSPEEKELQMKREYDEFVRKQKEAEQIVKDEKARKKRLKKSKRIEPVKVTNIFDAMADPDQVSSQSSLNNMTAEEKRRMKRQSMYTVKLLNREGMG